MKLIHNWSKLQGVISKETGIHVGKYKQTLIVMIKKQSILIKWYNKKISTFKGTKLLDNSNV